MSTEIRSARAEMKYARMSAFKIRDIARAMRGLSVKEADARLSFAPQKSARYFSRHCVLQWPMVRTITRFQPTNFGFTR